MTVPQWCCGGPSGRPSSVRGPAGRPAQALLGPQWKRFVARALHGVPPTGSRAMSHRRRVEHFGVAGVRVGLPKPGSAGSVRGARPGVQQSGQQRSWSRGGGVQHVSPQQQQQHERQKQDKGRKDIVLSADASAWPRADAAGGRSDGAGATEAKGGLLEPRYSVVTCAAALERESSEALSAAAAAVEAKGEIDAERKFEDEPLQAGSLDAEGPNGSDADQDEDTTSYNAVDQPIRLGMSPLTVPVQPNPDMPAVAAPEVGVGENSRVDTVKHTHSVELSAGLSILSEEGKDEHSQSASASYMDVNTTTNTNIGAEKSIASQDLQLTSTHARGNADGGGTGNASETEAQARPRDRRSPPREAEPRQRAVHFRDEDDSLRQGQQEIVYALDAINNDESAADGGAAMEADASGSLAGNDNWHALLTDHQRLILEEKRRKANAMNKDAVLYHQDNNESGRGMQRGVSHPALVRPTSAPMRRGWYENMRANRAAAAAAATAGRSRLRPSSAYSTTALLEVAGRQHDGAPRPTPDPRRADRSAPPLTMRHTAVGAQRGGVARHVDGGVHEQSTILDLDQLDTPSAINAADSAYSILPDAEPQLQGNEPSTRTQKKRTAGDTPLGKNERHDVPLRVPTASNTSFNSVLVDEVAETATTEDSARESQPDRQQTAVSEAAAAAANATQPRPPGAERGAARGNKQPPYMYRTLTHFASAEGDSPSKTELSNKDNTHNKDDDESTGGSGSGSLLMLDGTAITRPQGTPRARPVAPSHSRAASTVSVPPRSAPAKTTPSAAAVAGTNLPATAIVANLTGIPTTRPPPMRLATAARTVADPAGTSCSPFSVTSHASGGVAGIDAHQGAGSPSVQNRGPSSAYVVPTTHVVRSETRSGPNQASVQTYGTENGPDGTENGPDVAEHKNRRLGTERKGTDRTEDKEDCAGELQRDAVRRLDKEGDGGSESSDAEGKQEPQRHSRNDKAGGKEDVDDDVEGDRQTSNDGDRANVSDAAKAEACAKEATVPAKMHGASASSVMQPRPVAPSVRSDDRFVAAPLEPDMEQLAGVTRNLLDTEIASQVRRPDMLPSPRGSAAVPTSRAVTESSSSSATSSSSSSYNGDESASVGPSSASSSAAPASGPGSLSVSVPASGTAASSAAASGGGAGGAPGLLGSWHGGRDVSPVFAAGAGGVSGSSAAGGSDADHGRANGIEEDWQLLDEESSTQHIEEQNSIGMQASSANAMEDIHSGKEAGVDDYGIPPSPRMTTKMEVHGVPASPSSFSSSSPPAHDDAQQQRPRHRHQKQLQQQQEQQQQRRVRVPPTQTRDDPLTHMHSNHFAAHRNVMYTFEGGAPSAQQQMEASEHARAVNAPPPSSATYRAHYGAQSTFRVRSTLLGSGGGGNVRVPRAGSSQTGSRSAELNLTHAGRARALQRPDSGLSPPPPDHHQFHDAQQQQQQQQRPQSSSYHTRPSAARYEREIESRGGQRSQQAMNGALPPYNQSKSAQQQIVVTLPAASARSTAHAVAQGQGLPSDETKGLALQEPAAAGRVRARSPRSRRRQGSRQSKAVKAKADLAREQRQKDQERAYRGGTFTSSAPGQPGSRAGRSGGGASGLEGVSPLTAAVGPGHQGYVVQTNAPAPPNIVYAPELDLPSAQQHAYQPQEHPSRDPRAYYQGAPNESPIMLGTVNTGLRTSPKSYRDWTPGNPGSAWERDGDEAFPTNGHPHGEGGHSGRLAAEGTGAAESGPWQQPRGQQQQLYQAGLPAYGHSGNNAVAFDPTQFSAMLAQQQQLAPHGNPFATATGVPVSIQGTQVEPEPVPVHPASARVSVTSRGSFGSTGSKSKRRTKGKRRQRSKSFNSLSRRSKQLFKQEELQHQRVHQEARKQEEAAANRTTEGEVHQSEEKEAESSVVEEGSRMRLRRRRDTGGAAADG